MPANHLIEKLPEIPRIGSQMVSTFLARELQSKNA